MAYEELNILFIPCGPCTLLEVMKLAVAAVPSKLPVRCAKLAYNEPVTVNDPDITDDPIIVVLPLIFKLPVIP
jgi:hypothetical protein